MRNLYVSVLKSIFLPVILTNMYRMNLEQTEYKQQQLSLLLAYLKMQGYRFTTISPASHEKINNRAENAIANDLAGIFGWNRSFNAVAVEACLFDLMQSAKIVTQVENSWKSLLRVASLKEQLFLHSAYPTTGNEAVFFGPDTYRYANAIQHFLITSNQSIYRAVDIGTGSGAGAVLLAQALPEAEIIAADISNDALDLARINVESSDIHNIKLVHSDLLNDIKGNFDLIITNPPYLVDAAKRTYRHGGGQLGTELSLRIVDAAIQRLNSGGALLLYTGVAIVHGHDAFLAEVETKLKRAGFTFHYSEIDPDIFGEELLSAAYNKADRIAAVILTARKQTG